MAEKGLSGESDINDNDCITRKAMFGDFGGDKADYTLGNKNVSHATQCYTSSCYAASLTSYNILTQSLES